MAEQDKAAEVAKDARERLDDSIAWALSTEQGRRLLSHLIYRTSKIEEASYTGHAESTEFNEGQRSVGRWLLEQARRVDRTLVRKMWVEADVQAEQDLSNGNVHAEADSLA